jgi:hypothetical protein
MINLRTYFNDGPGVRLVNGRFCVGVDCGLHGIREVK